MDIIESLEVFNRVFLSFVLEMTDYRQLLLKNAWEKIYGELKQEISSNSPTVEAVRHAAKVIKNFCDAQNRNAETDCVNCPIQDICTNEPYLWEV